MRRRAETHWRITTADMLWSKVASVVTFDQAVLTFCFSPKCLNKLRNFREEAILLVMRIIAGKLKGVSVPESKAEATHPMSEKLRGAIFNALGDIEGLRVLDGCAGTGMVGFEAISRGAMAVDGVEKDDKAFAELSRNAKEIAKRNPTPYRAFHYGIRQFFKKNNLPVYDVMIFDPPYDLLNLRGDTARSGEISRDDMRALSEGGISIDTPIEEKLVDRSGKSSRSSVSSGKLSIVQTDHFDGTVKHLSPEGVMVFSLASGIEAPRLPGLKAVKQKTYGVAQLIYYQHN